MEVEELIKHGYVVRKVGFDATRRGVMKQSKAVFRNIIIKNILTKAYKNKFKYTNYVKINAFFIYYYSIALILNFTVSMERIMRFKPNVVFVITVFRNTGLQCQFRSF